MSEHIHKRHNKTLLLYHIVCPAKYRKKIFSEEVEKSLKGICLEIQKRYEINFVEIGIDLDHVHFLIQCVPVLSVSNIVKIIKGITRNELFKKHPEIKKELWGGNIWTSGYYANTVGQYGNMDVIKKYIENQGKEYKKIYDGQLTLFEDLI
jgi:putative transposase